MIDEVLEFWFGELSPEDWFEKKDATDAEIRSRFGKLYDELSTDRSLGQTSTARGVLATLIVLDQFPRNMFRDTAKTFATDGKALALAKSAIERGLDRELSLEERQFIYMPFQHSENRADQIRSVELFASVDDEKSLDYAQRHLDIIDRFGRFPHRNTALGRTSTPEEERFLLEPNSSF